MSKLQAIAFFEEISKNKQLAHEVEKVVGGKNSNEAKAKELLSLAKKHNFNFTQEEAASVRGTLKTSLSPEEMLEVSGGKIGIKSSLMAAAMLFGLGVGGTTLYSMNTSADGPEGSKQKQMEIIPSKQKDNTPTTRAPKKQTEQNHTKDEFNRYKGMLGCTARLSQVIRAQSLCGALPASSWPEVEKHSSNPTTRICRHCNSPVYRYDTEKHYEFRCTDDGCVDNWCFISAGTGYLPGQQRGGVRHDFKACCRWQLLPALILDARLHKARQYKTTPLVHGAEYWATAQLIIGSVRGWPLSPQLTLNTSEENIRQVNEVKRLLEDAYNRLNKEEMMQLIDGHNSNWTKLKEQFKKDITNAENLKKQNKKDNKLPKEVPEKTDQEIQATVDRLVALLEEAYKRITDDKLKSVEIDPGIAPDRIPSMLPLLDTTTAMDEGTFEQPFFTTPLMQQTNSLNGRQNPNMQASFGSTNQNMSRSPQMMNQMRYHQSGMPQHHQMNFLNTNSTLNNSNMINQMRPQQQTMNLNEMTQQPNSVIAMDPRARQEYIRSSIVENVKQYFSKPNPIADLDKEYKQNPKKVAMDLQAAVRELVNLPAESFFKEMIDSRNDQNGKISLYEASYIFKYFEDEVLRRSSFGRFLDLELRLYHGPGKDGLYGERQVLSGCVGRAQHMAVVAALNDIKNQLLKCINSDKTKQTFEAEITKRINEIDERFNTILSGQ